MFVTGEYLSKLNAKTKFSINRCAKWSTYGKNSVKKQNRIKSTTIWRKQQTWKKSLRWLTGTIFK